MSDSRSRMTRVCMGWLPRLAACVLALLVCHTLPQARAADVLLTGAEDSPGVQGFASALAQQRPEDKVRFVPFGQLPPPSKLPASTRLILLDPPSLDWRLADRQGPPTWCCVSAACKPASAWENNSHTSSACSGATHHRGGSCD